MLQEGNTARAESSMEAFRISDGNDKLGDEHGPTGALKSMQLTEWTSTDKTELGNDMPIFAVDNEKAFDSLIRPPNASDDDVQTVAAAANKEQTIQPKSCFLGALVGLGFIQMVHVNGQAQVITPGRYAMKLVGRGCIPPASWGKQHSLKQDHITDGPFTLVRVRRGQIGLAVENGKPVMLNEGVHVYNSPLFAFKECKEVSAQYIQHMSYHMLRVPKGSFAKVWEGTRAKLLPEGLHVVDNPVFKYEGIVSSAETYIQHGSIHLLQVPKGFLGLVVESSSPRLLHEGLHIFDSPMLKFSGTKSKMSPLVECGTISRFLVQKGTIALCWRDQEPVLVEEPGIYQVDSATFKFVEAHPATQKNIALGAKKIITVYSGEVGVSYNQGRLAILQPGRHEITRADHTFDDFLSTQQHSLRLVSHERKGTATTIEENRLFCETKDLVNIGIRADVFFCIADPERAITQIGRAGIDDLVMETSVAMLTNIMRNTPLSDIAQSSQPSAVSETSAAEAQMVAQATGQASAPFVFDKVHDQFIAKLHDDFMDKYGLNLTNIRIEQFKIMDEKLSSSISQQVVATAETQTKLANLEGETKIATQQQERDARVQQIQAQAEANARKVRAEADVATAEAEARAQEARAIGQATQLKVQAEGEAAAVKIRAEATVFEAEAAAKGIKIAAEADAEAIRLRAAAEGERAALLSKTELGQKLALLEVYAGVVKTSNEGVQKVVYVDTAGGSNDSGSAMGGNPLALLQMQSLTRDLQTLQSTGAAT